MSFLSVLKELFIALFAFLIFTRITRVYRDITTSRFIFSVCSYIVLPALILAAMSPYIIEPIRTISVIFFLSGLISPIKRIEFMRCVFCLGVSYIVSYILFMISAFISSVIFITIFQVQGENIFAFPLVFICESLFISILTKISFKIKIDFSKNVMSIGTAMSGIVLVLYGILRDEGTTATNYIIPLFGVVLCGMGLYWWLKKESILSFNEIATQKRTAELQKEIDETKKIVQKYAEELHTNDKEKAGYLHALSVYLNLADFAPAVAREEFYRLMNEAMTDKTRTFEEIAKEIRERKALPPTGMLVVDGIYGDYCTKATKAGIDFDLIVNGETRNIISKIPQKDLEMIVANLLDNAINAIKNSDNAEKRIIARIWDSSKGCGLSVEDTGARFDMRTLENLKLCKKQLTPDRENGIGLGFVTMLEALNNCGASMIITDNPNFKVIVVKFDGRNELIIDKYEKPEWVKFNAGERIVMAARGGEGENQFNLMT